MGMLDQFMQWRNQASADLTRARANALQQVGLDFQERQRQQLLAEQQAQQQQQGVGLAQQLYRQGLQSNPTAQSAVGLMQNPGSRGAGIALGLQLLDPKAQAELQGQALSNVRTAAGITQDAAEAPSRMEALRAQIAASRSATAKSQYELEQAKLAAAQPQPVLPFGEPPKGYFPVQSPSGDVQYIPQPGSEPYNKATDAIQQLEATLRDINQFQSSVEKAGASGTELIGPAANSLRFQRGNVLSRVAALRNLGVLQPAEYENLDSQLPDPTGIFRNLAGASGLIDPTGNLFDYQRQSIQEPYSQLRKEFETRLRLLRKQYWYVPTTKVLPEDK